MWKVIYIHTIITDITILYFNVMEPLVACYCYTCSHVRPLKHPPSKTSGSPGTHCIVRVTGSPSTGLVVVLVYMLNCWKAFWANTPVMEVMCKI